MLVSVVLLWIVSLIACRRAEEPVHLVGRLDVDELFTLRPIDIVSGR